MSLTACGSSGPASPPTAKASGAAAAPASAGVSSGGSASGLDLTRLGSFTNYSGTMTDNGVSISVRVHSPTDWELVMGNSLTIHIGGFYYGKSINAQGQMVWYKNTDNPQAYQQSEYPGAAGQFTGFTKVAGATIVRGAPCNVAGVAGHTWSIKSPSNSTLSEQETACVADRSGALLRLGTGASGSAVPSSGFSYAFTVTGVGNVPAIPVPSPVQSP